VVVGRDFGGTVEIQSGIEDGMIVVSNPNADLVDGMKVLIAPAPAEKPAANAAAPAGPRSGS
jgi:hypothetical protein